MKAASLLPPMRVPRIQACTARACQIFHPGPQAACGATPGYSAKAPDRFGVPLALQLGEEVHFPRRLLALFAQFQGQGAQP